MSLTRSTRLDDSRVPICVCPGRRETFAHRSTIVAHSSTLVVNLAVHNAELQSGMILQVHSFGMLQPMRHLPVPCIRINSCDLIHTSNRTLHR